MSGSCGMRLAVRITHYPTNTSVAIISHKITSMLRLKEQAMKILKVRILMAKRGEWSNKKSGNVVVRTYQGNPENVFNHRGVLLYGLPDENEFDLDEILKKEGKGRHYGH